MRGTWLIVGGSLLGATLLAGAAALLADRIADAQGQGPAARPAAPFTDLGSAIAARRRHPGWVVHRPPDLPGPYRVVGATFIIGNDPIYRAVWSHPDGAGRWVAPVELRGDPGFNQMAVHLETADGRIAGAVLRRPPDPPR